MQTPLGVCGGRVMLAPRGPQTRFGTKISPRSPFHPLLLKTAPTVQRAPAMSVESIECCAVADTD